MIETQKDTGPEADRPPSSAPKAGGEADADQLMYADVLAKGMYLGLVILLVTFVLYMTGLLQPGIPIEELPRLWTLSVDEYLETVNHEFLHRPEVVTGWGWLALLSMGDYLNFVGIALLAGVTIVCYARIIPGLFRKKDWIYATIAVLEVLVLLWAASGKMPGGGH